jgi:Glycosyl hydrolase family 12
VRHPLRTLSAVGLVLASAVVVAVATDSPAQANTRICEKFGTTTVRNRYIVMNNEWGADTPQCINVTNSGFAITANHNKPTNGAPASYTAIYYGCHYNNCSPGTNLPMRISQIHSARSSASFSFPRSGVYNGSYDIWLDPSPRKDGVNRQELMVWFNHRGPVHPVGSRVATVSIGGHRWDVWSGNNGSSDVVSYVARSSIKRWNFSILPFINNAKTRSKVTSSWYLTSIQAGFEPWVGGTGLAVKSFTASVTKAGSGSGSSCR